MLGSVAQKKWLSDVVHAYIRRVVRCRVHFLRHSGGIGVLGKMEESREGREARAGEGASSGNDPTESAFLRGHLSVLLTDGWKPLPHISWRTLSIQGFAQEGCRAALRCNESQDGALLEAIVALPSKRRMKERIVREREGVRWGIHKREFRNQHNLSFLRSSWGTARKTQSNQSGEDVDENGLGCRTGMFPLYSCQL